MGPAVTQPYLPVVVKLPKTTAAERLPGRVLIRLEHQQHELAVVVEQPKTIGTFSVGVGMRESEGSGTYR